MKSLLTGIKNVVLWSYARGTWQYDALCGLIVLTVLFWPARKLTAPAQGKMLPAVASEALPLANGMQQRDIGWQELREFLTVQNKLELINTPREAATLFLENETKAKVSITLLEPFNNAQGQIGYHTYYRVN